MSPGEAKRVMKAPPANPRAHCCLLPCPHWQRASQASSCPWPYRHHDNLPTVPGALLIILYPLFLILSNPY